METPAGASAAEVARYDAVGGNRTVVVPSEKLVLALLPGYPWAQVFAAVDRLTREGSVRFQHPGPFLYLLSLAPLQSVESGA